ncbi:capsular biosynthesis protein [Neobacillus piezotolerans]|uniref:Capsular biosynthesis protein n=1 Tax=Neobacillus piezotolerans TaxID=2259171 RepID=A0A3D8GNH2_9BACI|nr:Wzz/FepE/Etk N-terminal domain-containing protein [Neobacillus piezotolerans]RDU36044.1 capsular biosynthesis protein [Neobacillus piezotolerans]
MVERLSLREAAGVLRRRLWLVIALSLSTALVAGILSFFVLEPQYEYSSQFLVNQKSPRGVTGDDIRTNVELINTYKGIIHSPIILDGVIKELKLKMPAEKLREKINILSEESSQLVTVKVADPDPERAAAIANWTVRIFQMKIPQLMNVDNVKIISEARVEADSQPVFPNKGLNITIGIIIGTIAGAGIAYALEYLDSAVKTERDISEKLHVPVLGVISHIKDQDFASVRRSRAGRQNGRRNAIDVP